MYEPGLDDLIAAAHADGRITAITALTNELDDCDVAIVCVGTPSGVDGAHNMSYIAQVTIQIAGQRGWREPVSQEVVMRLALAAGDEAEAARRYTALLLRKNPPIAVLQELGPAVLGEAGGPGQQTMIAIISEAERWNGTFLRRGFEVMPASAFAEVTAGSIAQGAQFNCTALAFAAKRLVRRDAEAGKKLVTAAARQCPGLAV